MKQKLIGGAILALLLGLGFAAKKGYSEVEIAGCKRTILYSLEQQYGPAPDDVKGKVLEAIEKECRQIF
jgi:hypothetical protein